MSAKKGLGKGLGVLIDSANTSTNPNNMSGVVLVDINKIEPNKNQPRKFFDDDKLNELASSIKEHGVVQPIVVNDEGEYYSIIAGERRWRASRLAQVKEVPVIIKNYNELEILQIALIENIQRQDLNPIEEAVCYKRLVDEYLFSIDEISKKVSKSRATVNNYYNLTKLDARVQTLIMQNKLSHSQSKNLFLLEGDADAQYYFADKIADENISVKDAHTIITRYVENQGQEQEQEKGNDKINKDKNIINFETSLNEKFGTKVNIKNNPKTNKGKIEISYQNKDELDRLYVLFNNL